jgi:hypothetical protein
VTIDGVLDWPLILGTTSNYSVIANPHNLQITTAHPKSFPAYFVFTSRFLVTASNSWDSSASALKSSLNGGSLPTASFIHRLPYRTDLVAPIVFPYNSSARPAQTTPFILVSTAAGTCLPSCSLAAAVYSCLLRNFCLATDVVPLSVSRPLPRNECCFRPVRYQWLFLWLCSCCFDQVCHNTHIAWAADSVLK